ncbi:MAG: hypothetical protein ABJG18_15110, partial [Lentilitoribacter sp.]
VFASTTMPAYFEFAAAGTAIAAISPAVATVLNQGARFRTARRRRIPNTVTNPILGHAICGNQSPGQSACKSETRSIADDLMINLMETRLRMSK